MNAVSVIKESFKDITLKVRIESKFYNEDPFFKGDYYQLYPKKLWKK